MKKLIAILLAVAALGVFVSGCNKAAEGEGDGGTTAGKTTEGEGK
ncbi:MAG TPA: hypothetical protein PLH94_00100 [Fimbriimonadaceae bacterium]|nr:hypothetical protein [Fimbriimonadaceae bacterium]